MAEYIEREAAKGAVSRAIELYHLLNGLELDIVCGYIDRVSATDVAPVKHGHWNVGYFHDRVCSCCTHPSNDLDDYPYNFCPHCGAKMDD